jgi:hypothetical protein
MDVLSRNEPLIQDGKTAGAKERAAAMTVLILYANRSLNSINDGPSDPLHLFSRLCFDHHAG